MALVLGTHFSDQRTWQALCAAIQAPVGDYGFRASVDFVDDARNSGLGPDQLLGRFAKGGEQTFVLVVDLYTERGRAFRAAPSAIQAIENNLSIANMDFREFADAIDEDGVFRGFPQP